jgi:hypothetical protein
MTVEQALQTASKYAIKIRDAFCSALEKPLDDKRTRLLILLADHERKHLEHFRNACIKVLAEGTFDHFAAQVERQLDEVAHSLQHLDAELENVSVEERLVQILGSLNNAKAKTAAFYRGICQCLPPDDAKYFEHFVEVEEANLALIENRLEKYYFDPC